jgi:hypothetical protein
MLQTWGRVSSGEFCTGDCEATTCACEAEESPPLEAVDREGLVKTQQAVKGLADAVVICELWRLTVTLQLLVVPSRVRKWSINPFANPNPV